MHSWVFIPQNPCEIFVTLRDRFNNHVDANQPGAATVTVRVTDSKNSQGLVTKIGKTAHGLVNVEYTPATHGNHVVNVLV